MVNIFDRGYFQYNTLAWHLISWDLSHMGSTNPFSCHMHVIFQKAWSTNSIELYMRNVCLESIWLGSSILHLGHGLSQYWAKTTMWFGPDMFLIITSMIHWPGCIKTSMIHWTCSSPSMSMIRCHRHELTRTWIHRAHMKGEGQIIVMQGWISVPWHVFKLSVKDSTHHPFRRKLWGSPPRLVG
jgi:hypothetical protein